MKHTLLALALAALAGTSFADVSVRFDEGAPKDTFYITNEGTCALNDVKVVLDLGASAAGLIFDVTGSGAGVSVFQPLELIRGQDALVSVPEVRDGDAVLELPVRMLPPGAGIAFTIDVDDTRGSAATMISGGEIEGAEVIVKSQGTTLTAPFKRDATAVVGMNSCNA